MRFSRVVLLAILGAVAVAVVPAFLPTGPSGAAGGSYATALLAQGKLWFAALIIFLGGLGTSLTPCVYPLIPITVGVFGARQADSRGRAFILTSAYVIGMGVVFSSLGVVAAFSGKAFGSSLSQPLFLIILAVVMVALAASMFGAFELAVPPSVALKLNSVGGGGLVGAFLMGSVAGFLAAPCTGPVLSSVLVWVAQTHDPVIGGALLFVYAMGIGVPFFLIGVFALRLPKGGAWMDAVKSGFGIALLVLAVSYLKDAVPSLRTFIEHPAASLGAKGTIALAAGLVLAGVLLGAVHRNFVRSEVVLKTLGVMAVLLGVVLRLAAPVPAPAGGGDGFQWRLAFNASASNSVDPFEEALAEAKASCKPVLIDFFAEWCAACKELDTHTYVAKEVIEESKRFFTIKVDGTTDHDVLDKLYERFGIKGLPTVAFLSPKGEMLSSPRVTGFLAAKDFVGEMQKVAVTTCDQAP